MQTDNALQEVKASLDHIKDNPSGMGVVYSASHDAIVLVMSKKVAHEWALVSPIIREMLEKQGLVAAAVASVHPQAV